MLRSITAIFLLMILPLVFGGCSEDDPDPTAPVVVDDPGLVSLERTSWFWPSAPFQSENIPDLRSFGPEDRVEAVRWFLPRERTLRRYLNPDLINMERDLTQPTLDLFLRDDDGSWDPEDWGGITQGLDRVGRDLSNYQYLEIWVNDGIPDVTLRRGKLHIDFGYISEDGFWPEDSEGNLVIGRQEREDGIVDGIPDGVFVAPEEDIGLDGNEFGPQLFSPEYEIDGDSPYPRINGTARNNREDSEDLNGDSWLTQDNGFFAVVIDLRQTEALVDVVQDYADVDDLVAENIAWRHYRLSLAALDTVSRDVAPNLKFVTHVRIWYEDPIPGGRAEVTLQLSGLRFSEAR